MNKPLYRELASLIVARENCRQSNNQEWFYKHEERIESLVKEHMPSGSGFDNGTKLDLDTSTGERLVFTTSYHHMNDGGMYDGWTEHTIIVKPSLCFGFALTISGRDRNDIKEYMHEAFSTALSEEVQ